MTVVNSNTNSPQAASKLEILETLPGSVIDIVELIFAAISGPSTFGKFCQLGPAYPVCWVEC